MKGIRFFTTIRIFIILLSNYSKKYLLIIKLQKSKIWPDISKNLTNWIAKKGSEETFLNIWIQPRESRMYLSTYLSLSLSLSRLTRGIVNHRSILVVGLTMWRDIRAIWSSIDVEMASRQVETRYAYREQRAQVWLALARACLSVHVRSVSR